MYFTDSAGLADNELFYNSEGLPMRCGLRSFKKQRARLSREPKGLTRGQRNVRAVRTSSYDATLTTVSCECYGWKSARTPSFLNVTVTRRRSR